MFSLTWFSASSSGSFSVRVTAVVSWQAWREPCHKHDETQGGLHASSPGRGGAAAPWARRHHFPDQPADAPSTAFTHTAHGSIDGSIDAPNDGSGLPSSPGSDSAAISASARRSREAVGSGAMLQWRRAAWEPQASGSCCCSGGGAGGRCACHPPLPARPLLPASLQARRSDCVRASRTCMPSEPLRQTACQVSARSSPTRPSRLPPAGPAAARLEGVNKPELLPPGPVTPVIDVAGFLTEGEEARIKQRVVALERDTGVRLRWMRGGEWWVGWGEGVSKGGCAAGGPAWAGACHDRACRILCPPPLHRSHSFPSRRCACLRAASHPAIDRKSVV